MREAPLVVDLHVEFDVVASWVEFDVVESWVEFESMASGVVPSLR